MYGTYKGNKWSFTNYDRCAIKLLYCSDDEILAVENADKPVDAEIAVTLGQSGNFVSVQYGDIDARHVLLFSMDGRLVCSKPANRYRTEMQTDHLGSGAYLVAVIGENKTYRKKFLIVR